MNTTGYEIRMCYGWGMGDLDSWVGLRLGELLIIFGFFTIHHEVNQSWFDPGYGNGVWGRSLLLDQFLPIDEGKYRKDVRGATYSELDTISNSSVIAVSKGCPLFISYGLDQSHMSLPSDPQQSGMKLEPPIIPHTNVRETKVDPSRSCLIPHFRRTCH